MNKVKKTRFATKIVIASIICIIVYIIIDIMLLCIIGSEPEITPYVFGFFGGELSLLAAKRIFEYRKKTEVDEENTEEGNG